MTSSQIDPSLQDFEKLFIKDDALSKIQNYLDKFNPIKIMRMQYMEIRHSAILAWLLDPQESHGLDDQFLKAFLSTAFSEPNNSKLSLKALEIYQANMMDAEVRREWKNIDLLVISRQNGWIFIIENKFHSKQGKNQLKDYFDKVDKFFNQSKHGSLTPHGIFLTLHDEEPDDDRYVESSYGDICRLLSGLIDKQTRPINDEVRIFINHYLEVLMDATDQNDKKDEMIKLARQLYREHRKVLDFMDATDQNDKKDEMIELAGRLYSEHRKVLDFVVEHGADNSFVMACEDIVEQNMYVSYGYPDFEVNGKKFVYWDSSSYELLFMPKSWYDAFGGDDGLLYWYGCDDWGSGFPLSCRLLLCPSFDKNEASIRLFAEVGPLDDHKFRLELISAIKDTASEHELSDKIGFRKDAIYKGRQSSKFLKSQKTKETIRDENDAEEIRQAMIKLLSDFYEPFEKISKCLHQFKKYGKTKEKS